MKKIINQSSFTAGVLSPDLYYRTDTAEYKRGGLLEGTNIQVDLHGGFRKVNGKKYVSKGLSKTVTSKLIEYQFSPTVSYMLEFGNQILHFNSANAQILKDTFPITAVSTANPSVFTSTAHTLSNGDQVYITGVVGVDPLNSSTIPYTVANDTADTFTLVKLDGTNFTTSDTYTSGGTVSRIMHITTPYSTADLANLYHYQDGNILYLLHPSYAPRQLTRLSDTSWALAEVAFDILPSYEYGHAPALTLTLSATTGLGITATLSGAGFFLQGDVGRQILDIRTGKLGTASIKSVTSATIAIVDITTNFADASLVSTEWKIDLSPIVQINFSNPQLGSITTVTSGFISSNTSSTGVAINDIDIIGDDFGNPYEHQYKFTTATAHGLIAGDIVHISGIVGATSFNDKDFYVYTAATTTTFGLGIGNVITDIHGTTYPPAAAYVSGGIVNQSFSGSFVAKDAFRSADVGKYILVNGGVLKIIAVASSTTISALVLKELNEVTATPIWSLETSAWNSTDGYPEVVTIHDQRAVYCGSVGFPTTIWCSEIGLYQSFGAGPDEEDSLEFKIVAEKAFRIAWAKSHGDLVIGSTIGEFVVNSGSANFSLSPTHNSAKLLTYYGSKLQIPLSVDEEILFVQASAKKIRTYIYDVDRSSYSSEHLLFLAEQYVTQGIRKMAYCKEPNSLVYILTNDYRLLCGAYDRKQKMAAWTEVVTNGHVKDIASLNNDGIDQLWLLVERTDSVYGKSHNIEVLNYSTGIDHTAGYSDSYLIYSVPLTITSITNDSTKLIFTITSHGLIAGDTFIVKHLVDDLTNDTVDYDVLASTLNNSVFEVDEVVNSSSFKVIKTETGDTFNTNITTSGRIYKLVETLTGLEHLNGMTVSIRGDGATQDNQLVSNGAITLTDAVGEVVVGLPYHMNATTLPIVFDMGMGQMLGQQTRWVSPLVYVVDSSIPTINTYGEQPEVSTSTTFDQANVLYTGYLEYGNTEYTNTSSISFVSDEPQPVYVLGYTGTIEAGVK